MHDDVTRGCSELKIQTQPTPIRRDDQPLQRGSLNRSCEKDRGGRSRLRKATCLVCCFKVLGLLLTCPATYAIYTSPHHAPVPYHLPTLIVTPHGQPQHILYSYIHANYNKETYLLTPSMQGDLCVAKTVPPPGSRRLDGAGTPPSSSRDRSVFCEASRNLKWTITNTGIHAPVYKLTLPNPDAPGNDQPLFQISKPNPNATWRTMFYFTYAGHLIPPKRIEFGRIQKNAVAGEGGGAGTRVTITGRTPEEKAVWQTLGEGNEDMVEWIVLCAALNLIDEEIVRAAGRNMGNAARSPSAHSPSPTNSLPQSPMSRTGSTAMRSGPSLHGHPGGRPMSQNGSGTSAFGRSQGGAKSWFSARSHSRGMNR